MAALPAFVQGTSGNSSGATNPMVMTAFASPVTNGNFIMVTTCDDSGTNTGVTNVTDNFSNTYTQLFAVHGTSSMQTWYAKDVKGGSSLAISVTWNTGAAAGVSAVAQEFSNVHKTAPVDTYLVGGPTSSTAASSGASSRVIMADEMIIGASVHAGASSAYSLGATFTNLTTQVATGRDTAMESKVVATGGTQTATFSILASSEWICAVVCLKSIPTATMRIGLRPHPFSPGLSR